MVTVQSFMTIGQIMPKSFRYRRWTQTGYLNKNYNINQKDEDT